MSIQEIERAADQVATEAERRAAEAAAEARSAREAQQRAQAEIARERHDHDLTLAERLAGYDGAQLAGQADVDVVNAWSAFERAAKGDFASVPATWIAYVTAKRRRFAIEGRRHAAAVQLGRATSGNLRPSGPVSFLNDLAEAMEGAVRANVVDTAVGAEIESMLGGQR